MIHSSNLVFRKATASGDEDCVEVAQTDAGGWAIRNSKDHGQGLLEFARGEVLAFVEGLKSGEFGTFD